MHIPGLGEMTLEERYELYVSQPIPLMVLGDKSCRFTVEGYKDDARKEDFHAAIAAFLAAPHTVLRAAEPHVFRYYQDVNEGLSPGDDFYVGIATPADVWDHIKLGDMAIVSRRYGGDEGIYVSLECNCDWEQEHGLQIVFRHGKEVCKVGSYDGHLTNADAYADPSLENVIYR